MEIIQIWYTGTGKGTPLRPQSDLRILVETLTAELPDYQIRLGGVSADVPTAIETVSNTIEAIRILSVMVPWDWNTIASAFGLGAAAGAGEAVGKGSVAAARKLFTEIARWVRKQPHPRVVSDPRSQSIDEDVVTISITNPRHRTIAKLQIDLSTENDPIVVPASELDMEGE